MRSYTTAKHHQTTRTFLRESLAVAMMRTLVIFVRIRVGLSRNSQLRVALRSNGYVLHRVYRQL